MKRTLTTLTTLTTLALTVLLAGSVAVPATAQRAPTYPCIKAPCPTAPYPRVIPIEKPPLCVSTNWRARHTHSPKTQPGEFCTVTAGMWIPKSWVRVRPGVVQRPYGG